MDWYDDDTYFVATYSEIGICDDGRGYGRACGRL